MLRLEVAGKLLLLLAGLPAVFDLIKPETLRRWSERLGARSKAYRNRGDEFRVVADTAYLQAAIRLDFVRASAVATPGGPVVTGERLYWTPPDRSPVPGVSTDEFASFWHEVMDDVRERLRVSEKSAPPADVHAAFRHIERRIDEFLRSSLPSREAGYVGVVDSYREKGSRQVLRQMLVLATILLVALAVATAIPATRARLSQPVDNLVFPLVSVVLLLGLVQYMLLRSNYPGTIEAVLLRSAARSLTALASPVRPLRLVALICFIAGSLIEFVLVLQKP